MCFTVQIVLVKKSSPQARDGATQRDGGFGGCDDQEMGFWCAGLEGCYEGAEDEALRGKREQQSFDEIKRPARAPASGMFSFFFSPNDPTFLYILPTFGYDYSVRFDSDY